MNSQSLVINTSINPFDLSVTNNAKMKKLNSRKNHTRKVSKQKKKTSKSAATTNKTGKAKKKREEEARRLREEEEARVRAEIAEKERIENEKRLAEERAIVAKEINELRRRELSEFYEFILPRQDEAHDLREKQREEFKWKRVMQCDGTPDPSSLLEINTFISLWRDEQQRINVEYTMKQTNLVLSLIKELYHVINSISKDSPENERIPIYKNTIHELEDTLHYKWRQTAHSIMLKATDLQDFETNNFQYIAENENVALCIWANLSHNPRIKGYFYEKFGFGFDLPKPLSLANIAIVGFFLKYDYYSERSLLAKCRVRTNEYSYDPIPEPLVDETVKPVAAEVVEEEPIDPSLPADIRKLMEQSRRREKEAAAAAAAAAAEAEAKAAKEAAEQAALQNAEEAKDEDDVPQNALNRKKSIRDVTADLILEELADESVVDLRSHWPVLPLIQVNLYNIPPQPKKVQEWTIMQVDDDNVLVRYPYPSDPMLAKRFYEEHASSNKNKGTETDTEKPKMDLKMEDPMDPSMTLDGTMIANNPEVRKMFLAAALKQESAIVLKYKIPTDVYVTEKPLLARWIEDRNHWKQEGFVDYEYAPDTRMISFKTYDFGTYALLNDRHAHMPFQSWRMRPKASCCILLVQTRFIFI
ncbi:unnamed protein product [Adineta steineri]|uniref:IC97/Casc1 N-terminal domain-containing protein n=3 Tax=Adineta steineri TaxID=433720 RepID=A0A818IF46_9BILA|nr:unnamed protein product [Adineta steineri]